MSLETLRRTSLEALPHREDLVIQYCQVLSHLLTEVIWQAFEEACQFLTLFANPRDATAYVVIGLAHGLVLVPHHVKVFIDLGAV